MKATKKADLPGEISNYFSFTGPSHYRGATFMDSIEFTRKEVERIAFDSKTPDFIAENFQQIINRADRLMRGESDTFKTVGTNKNYVWPEYRIKYILYKSGLNLYLD